MRCVGLSLFGLFVIVLAVSCGQPEQPQAVDAAKYDAIIDEMMRGTAGIKPPADRTPTASLTADALWREYQGNEIAAERKYRDRYVQVSGTVTYVRRDNNGVATVGIGLGADYAPLAAIEARFPENATDTELATLKVNERTEVTCTPVMRRPEGLLLNFCIAAIRQAEGSSTR